MSPIKESVRIESQNNLKHVRMYDELKRTESDNPTIGILLCTDKNETIVKYSMLNDNQQLFASKYMLYLPTEKELKAEIEKNRLM